MPNAYVTNPTTNMTESRPKNNARGMVITLKHLLGESPNRMHAPRLAICKPASAHLPHRIEGHHNAARRSGPIDRNFDACQKQGKVLSVKRCKRPHGRCHCSSLPAELRLLPRFLYPDIQLTQQQPPGERYLRMLGQNQQAFLDQAI